MGVLNHYININDLKSYVSVLYFSSLYESIHFHIDKNDS